MTDQSVDIVLKFKSLHHVPLVQLDDALLETHRVLKLVGFVFDTQNRVDLLQKALSAKGAI